jgi:exosortase A-associated hydrolase 2
MPAALHVHHQPAPAGGWRLYLHHSPPATQALRGLVVYAPPWAEEMNKSRRMAALASRQLAEDGFAVLQPDLLGCGDSSGDLAEASWAAWVDDVLQAARWLLARHPGAPLWLWGLRSGALLASEAAARLGTPVNLLFWQPVLQGKAPLQQFLRLKAAAQLADGGGKAILAATRAELAAGRPVEIAGYTLPAALAQGLEAAQLAPPASPGVPPGRLVWLELAPPSVAAEASAASPATAPALSPASQAAWPRWQAAGWDVQTQAVPGPAFWQTTEIESAPELLTATRQQVRAAATAMATTRPAPALA